MLLNSLLASELARAKQADLRRAAEHHRLLNCVQHAAHRSAPGTPASIHRTGCTTD